MGSDEFGAGTGICFKDFNPRSPHGERHITPTDNVLRIIFQSTLPAWGATEKFVLPIRRFHYFNPRSRMGSDNRSVFISFEISHFNPRSRMGSDPACPWSMAVLRAFQSTLPHGERQVSIIDGASSGLFQSTLPHGERRRRWNNFNGWDSISIHAPAWGATT